MDVQNRRGISRTVEGRGWIICYWVVIGSHICRVDWHNNRWPWVTSNTIRIARYLCGRWASCCCWRVVLGYEDDVVDVAKCWCVYEHDQLIIICVTNSLLEFDSDPVKLWLSLLLLICLQNLFIHASGWLTSVIFSTISSSSEDNSSNFSASSSLARSSTGT